MAFHQHHDIDYHIVVHKKPTKTEEFEETRCTNDKCENHHIEMKEGVNFCPKCGSKVDWLDVTETNEYDYLDEEFKDSYLHDWFFTPRYIDLFLGKDYETIKLKEGQELIIPNQEFNVNSEEEFRNHPATKALLELVGECDIHYGLVLYQS